jgi:hypothetical protein
VVDGGGADSILQFRFYRGGDVMKYYRKMKRRQPVHLSSMGRKCDTTRRRDDISWRRGDTGGGRR